MATHPWKAIIACLAITIAGGSGLLRSIGVNYHVIMFWPWPQPDFTKRETQQAWSFQDIPTSARILTGRMKIFQERYNSFDCFYTLKWTFDKVFFIFVLPRFEFTLWYTLPTMSSLLRWWSRVRFSFSVNFAGAPIYLPTAKRSGSNSVEEQQNIPGNPDPLSVCSFGKNNINLNALLTYRQR